MCQCLPCVTSTFQKHKCGSVAVKIPYSICHDIDGSVVPVTSHSLGVFWTTNKTSAGKGGITFLSLIASGGTHCFPGFLLILKIEGGSHLLLFTPCFTVAQSFFQSSSTASPDRTRRPDGSPLDFSPLFAPNFDPRSDVQRLWHGPLYSPQLQRTNQHQHDCRVLEPTTLIARNRPHSSVLLAGHAHLGWESVPRWPKEFRGS